MTNVFICPIEDWACPYCEKDGVCALGFPAHQICEDAKEAQDEMRHAPAVIHRHADGSWS